MHSVNAKIYGLPEYNHGVMTRNILTRADDPKHMRNTLN
jgi:hypothetical protein